MKIVIAAGIEKTDRPDVLDVVRCREAVGKVLRECGHSVRKFDLTESLFREPGMMLREIRSMEPDLVFNLFEGWSTDAGQEAEFVRILEAESIAFTGNRSSALSSCLDKMGVKKRLTGVGLTVPAGFFIKSSEELENFNTSADLFIKPCHEDGNVGIDESSFLPASASFTEVRNRLSEKLSRFPRGILAEEFIPGIEYSAGCIGTHPYEVIGISIMDYSRHPAFPPFYTYRAKWDESAPVYSALTPVQGAEIDPDVKSRILDIISKAGKELELSSYFRIDMREKNGLIYVLDVNPNPDINPDSGLARQASAYGLSYRDLICRIVDTAVKMRRKNHD